MSEQQLFEGWQMMKFGDIAKHISKRVEPSETELEIYVGLEHLDPDSLRINRHGVPSDVEGQKLLAKKGQVIFGKRRAYQRKVAVADWDCICSAHAMVLEANPKNVISEFLPFFMQSDSFMNRAVAISEGSLSPTIKWKILAQQSFPFPNLEEQAKLLQGLNSVERSLDLGNEVLDQAYSLKRILITKFFSKSFVSGFEYKEVCLADVIDIQSGQVDPTKSPYCDLPHIAPDNMTKVTGKLLEYRLAKDDGVTSGKYFFDDSWVLYSKIRPNLRKICFPRFSGVCSADVYPIKGKNSLSTEYLFYLLQSEHFNKYAISTSTRSGFPKINRGDLGAYRFYLPEEKAQRIAVSSIAEVDQVIESCIGCMKSPVNIKKALISKEKSL